MAQTVGTAMQPIAEWLNAVGLGQYAQRFADNDIDANILRDLTDADLEKIGVSLGHRKRMLRAIAALDGSAAPAEPTPANEAERRQLTIMFCDLVGSTTLSNKLDPEELREIISAFHRCCAEQIAMAGGVVARYMGDGMLVYFGFPRANEDDAERAVRAGLALIGAVAQLGDGAGAALRVRVGIATGLVVVGDLLGKGVAQEHQAIGETPNLAARLQALAEPNEVAIDGTTRSLLGELFEYRAFGSVPLKGFGTPLPVWQVIGRSAVDSRFEALRATRTPLVGRDEEIDLLMRRWQQAKGGAGSVVLISGEPGIGKSRLTQAALERLSGEPHTLLRLFCSPHRQDSALYPAIRQLERAAGFRPGDTPEQRLDKLEGILSEATNDLSETAPLIADLLSVPTSDRYAPVNLSPQKRKEATFRALLQRIEKLAASQPVLFFLEDAHWIDPTSREWLELTIDRVPTLPVLLIITFRPEFTAPWTGQPHAHLMALSRLDMGESRALVQNVSGNHHLPNDLIEEIVLRADGVPLFIEELTKAVLEAGIVADTKAHDTMSVVPSARIAVPATLRASLIARLDRLGPRAKEVVQVGAVIGRKFSYEMVGVIARATDYELRASLGQLVEAGLIFQRGTPPDATYVFKHALVQDVAYGTLLRVRRQALHERIAKNIEERYAELVETQPELLAHHLTKAGLPDLAIDFWHKAGERALRRSANAEAVKHLIRGIELTQSMATSVKNTCKELDLQIALGPAVLATKGNGAPESLRVYLRARDLLGESGTHTQRMRVNWGLWNIHYRRAELKASLGVAEQHLTRATHEGYGEASANRLMGQTLCVMGALVDARCHLQRTVDLCIANQDDPAESLIFTDNQVGALSFLGRTLWPLGFPEQAAVAVAKAVALARSIGHALTTAVALYGGLRLEVFGWADPQRKANYADELLAHSLEHKLLDFENSARFYLGAILARRGDPKHGIEIMRDCMERAEKVGSHIHLPKRLGYLATAYASFGQQEVSLALLDEAIRAVETTSERLFESELYRLRGELFLNLGRTPEAESALQRAMTIARQQKARLWELHAAMSLARYWRDRGLHSAAVGLLRPIYAWFTEGFEIYDLKEAKTLLDELSSERL